jgi:hypothetical protein
MRGSHIDKIVDNKIIKYARILSSKSFQGKPCKEYNKK